MNEPFRISRGAMTHVAGILVSITDEKGRRGRGVAYGIIYEGETPETLQQQVESVADRVQARPVA